MGVAELWSRTLVYFGIAEEDEDYYELEDGYTAEETLEQSYRDRPNVRRLTPRRRGQDFDDWTDSSGDVHVSEPRARGLSRVQPTRPVLRAAPGANVQVHLVVPRSFNDAQQIADRFKNGVPVIVNLQTSDPDLSKRMIDFSSGMTYALDGAIQRIAEKVFLLTPANVEVSAEDRQRLVDQGFFNPNA